MILAPEPSAPVCPAFEPSLARGFSLAAIARTARASGRVRRADGLTGLINALKGKDAVDSPVYTVLADLQRPSRPGATRMAAAAAQPESPEDSYAAKLETAREAMDAGAFDFAKKILQGVDAEQTTPGKDGSPRPGRPGIVQNLALATYKAGEARARDAGPEQALAGYAEAETLLRRLNAETTTDPETTGLWSAIPQTTGRNGDKVAG